MGRPLFPTVINKTSLRGDDLLRFIRAGVKARGAQGTVEEIEVRESTSFRTTGLCWPEERRILLMVPRGFEAARDAEELGQVLEHEIDHALGLDHVDMQDWWTLPVPWVEGLKLRKRSLEIRKVIEEYERKIRELVIALDEVWEPRSTEVRVFAAPRRGQRAGPKDIP